MANRSKMKVASKAQVLEALKNAEATILRAQGALDDGDSQEARQVVASYVKFENKASETSADAASDESSDTDAEVSDESVVLN